MPGLAQRCTCNAALAQRLPAAARQHAAGWPNHAPNHPTHLHGLPLLSSPRWDPLTKEIFQFVRSKGVATFAQIDAHLKATCAKQITGGFALAGELPGRPGRGWRAGRRLAPGWWAGLALPLQGARSRLRRC